MIDSNNNTHEFLSYKDGVSNEEDWCVITN